MNMWYLKISFCYDVISDFDFFFYKNIFKDVRDVLNVEFLEFVRIPGR